MSEETQPWTQLEAIGLCRKVEAIAPKFGCHVALTGGLLYKDGPRKDLDILFYRIRQAPKIEKEKLFMALEKLDVIQDSGFGWCHKATWVMPDGLTLKSIDIFFPEEDDGAEYQPNEGLSIGDEQLTGTDQNMLGKPSVINNLADGIQNECQF